MPKIELNSNEEYFNIRLDSLEDIISKKVLNLLGEHDINTVGDLLTKSQSQSFYSFILRQSIPVYKEINYAIKLLKCKYLDIDKKFTLIEQNQ